MSVTMAEIDLLRDVADKATERYRREERVAGEALVRLTEVALAPTMHCDDGALEEAADAYCCAADLSTDALIQKEKAEAAVVAALAAYHARPQVARFVLFHPEAGVYLGNAMGLGFWSLWDPVGQEVAVTFASEAEAMEHVATWDGDATFNAAVTAREVLCATVEGSTVPHYATIAECFRAGLPRWDPNARPEGT